MSDSRQGRGEPENLDTPEDDPEIAALLGFEPVPRKREVDGAWTPELQREFIARLAVTGSPGRASEEMGKTDTGVRKLYRSPEGASFRAAWDGAVDLARRRREDGAATEKAVVAGSRPPSVDGRRKKASSSRPLPSRGEGAEGQVLNEFGEYEDEESVQRRAEEARDRIANKLLCARRLYLQEISASAGKRAAFEILTELPVDWERAGRLEPQAHEPRRRVSMREPDMLLTAENGWVGGLGYGPDRIGELRAAIDEYREEQGMEPVDWDGEREE